MMRNRLAFRLGRPVKLSLMAGALLLALSLSAPHASATPTYFYANSPSPFGSYIGRYGNIQTYTAPTTGLYDVLATGAPGSNNGYGAQIGGDFTLTQGETLEIAVGQSGRAGNGSGGGGGTFVVAPGNVPLVVAGGGGGAGGNANLDGGGSASLTPNGAAGSNGSGGSAGAGGVNGSGGSGGAGTTGGGGGGGGGFDSSGGNGSFAGSLVSGGGGGGSFAAGLIGGPGASSLSSGGFNDGGYGGGGGGGTGSPDTAGGGGGGGYSGGGGGTNGGGGGGGGSYDSGTNQFFTIDTYADSGSVVITPLAAPVPEPASLALFGVGLSGLLAMRRRKR